MALDKLIWWLEAEKTAGLMAPFIDPMRRFNGGGGLTDYDDDLADLYCQGIRSAVSLLNIRSDQRVFENAGFRYLSSPVKDFCAPEKQQALEICHFIENSPNAVAVFCEGGLGKTGTLLASWLIYQGLNPEEALGKVRLSEPGAVESTVQHKFLYDFADFISG